MVKESMAKEKAKGSLQKARINAMASKEKAKEMTKVPTGKGKKIDGKQCSCCMIFFPDAALLRIAVMS